MHFTKKKNIFFLILVDNVLGHVKVHLALKLQRRVDAEMSANIGKMTLNGQSLRRAFLHKPSHCFPKEDRV